MGQRTNSLPPSFRFLREHIPASHAAPCHSILGSRDTAILSNSEEHCEDTTDVGSSLSDDASFHTDSHAYSDTCNTSDTEFHTSEFGDKATYDLRDVADGNAPVVGNMGPSGLASWLICQSHRARLNSAAPAWSPEDSTSFKMSQIHMQIRRIVATMALSLVNCSYILGGNVAEDIHGWSITAYIRPRDLQNVEEILVLALKAARLSQMSLTISKSWVCRAVMYGSGLPCAWVL